MAPGRSLDTRSLAETVTLIIGTRRYPAWSAVSVMGALDRLSGSFSVTGTKVWTEDGRVVSRPVTAGMACRVDISGTTVITGSIDSDTLTAEKGELGLEGRDATALVVDVSTPGRSWNGSTLLAIATDLCTPLGVPVRLVNWDGGTALPKYAADPGETIASALEDACRQFGVMMWTDGSGALLIGRPAGTHHVGTLTIGPGVSAFQAKTDLSGRYHTYQVVGQKAGDDLWSDGDHAQGGTAVDPEIDPRRIKVITAENQLPGGASGQARAEHECRIARARSRSVTLTVTGWRAPDRSLWRPAQTLDLDHPDTAGWGRLMVSEARLTRDLSGGTTTALTLVPEDAYTLLPEGSAQSKGDNW